MHESTFLHALNTVFEPPSPLVKTIFQKHGSFGGAFGELKSRDPRLLQIDLQRVQEELDGFQDRFSTELMCCDDARYPALLKEIPDPPLGLYVVGTIPQQEYIGVVGTRKPTRYGIEIATRFARELAHCGIAVISGLAYGIDQAAHRGVLEVKGGSTIAVVGSGVDVCFDGPTRDIAQKIVAQSGALISEYPFGSPGLPHHFPARNRIVAGLSRGVLVVEAPIRSGALITARFAMEYNREVFVVPGDIFSKNFEGSHRLIQKGAKLVTGINDILEEVSFALPFPEPSFELQDDEARMYQLFQEGPLSLEELQGKAALPASQLLAIVTILEVKGLIKNVGGKFIVHRDAARQVHTDDTSEKD